MITKSILITVTFYICFLLESQTIFSVKYPNQADLKVFVVRHPNQADLLVYKVKYKNQAVKNEGKWYFTEYSNLALKKFILLNIQT